MWTLFPFHQEGVFSRFWELSGKNKGIFGNFDWAISEDMLRYRRKKIKNWQSCGNMQSNYVLLLDNRLKPLGHFADQALQSTADYDFFRFLCVNWTPCIKQVQLLLPVKKRWDENLQKYHRDWKKTEKEAVNQITNACIEIKQRLQSKRLFKNQEITDRLALVENILSGEEKFCLPPYYEVAYDRMKDLLQFLFDIGKKNILVDLANIVYPNKNDKKLNPKAKPYLHSFSFSSAILDLSYLKKMKSRENFHDSWVAWENICLALWCWQHGREYFQRQELNYDSIKACAQSGFLLELHSLYCEMSSIKERRKRPSSITFFSQERFKEYVKVLMNDILLFQEELKADIKQDNKIYALRLELEQNLLYLSVEWAKDKDGFRYLLHSFQENSAQLEILRSFFSKIESKTVDLKDSTSGNNSIKFLQRIGLIEELKAIFVEKTTTYTVTFRGKRVELNSLASIDQTKLIQQIERLPQKVIHYEKRNDS